MPLRSPANVRGPMHRVEELASNRHKESYFHAGTDNGGAFGPHAVHLRPVGILLDAEYACLCTAARQTGRARGRFVVAPGLCSRRVHIARCAMGAACTCGKGERRSGRRACIPLTPFHDPHKREFAPGAAVFCVFTSAEKCAPPGLTRVIRLDGLVALSCEYTDLRLEEALSGNVGSLGKIRD